MSTPTDNFTGTKPVADHLQFDTAALAAYLNLHLAGSAGELTVEQFKAGNLTRPICCARPTALRLAM
jgi:aminoglycoside phosphotransferase (APT) family kinase protein